MTDTADTDAAPTAHTNAPLPTLGAGPPADGLTATMARQMKIAAGVEEQASDVKRICSVSITRELTKEELEEFCRRNVEASYFDQGFRLFEPQARAILFFDRYGGVFAPISCGGGKTLLSFMIAERHWRRNPTDRVLYLVPPEVYAQITKQIGTRPSDLSWARRRVQLTVPWVGLGGADAAERERLVRRLPAGLVIMPHSLMSTRDASAVLDLMSPRLVIVDEAHRFKNRSAARTRRLMDYVVKKMPKLVVLSGSITNKSLRDYHHFLKPCLGVRSPLPFPQHLALEWAAVMDSEANPTDEMKRPLTPLIEWARFFFRVDLPESVTGFRRAYKLRMASCPGVVSTVDSGVPCTLILANGDAPHAHADQQEALAKIVTTVDQQWETPNGDPIDHAIHKFQWLYQLSSGFYYKLVWPDVATVMLRKGVSKIEAEDLLLQSKACHALHGEYQKTLRRWFADHPHRAGLDTPWLVGQEMAKHGPRNVGPGLYTPWQAWKVVADALGEDLIERDSMPVRVCDFKVRAVRAWVQALRKQAPDAGAIVWWFHQEAGEWIAEVLRQALGSPDAVLFCPAGDVHNKTIIDPANKQKIVVASMNAHGTGKNLQHFEHQLFAQWPRSATLAEQTLARTHRPGQEADELRVGLLNTTDMDKQVFAACLRDACYVQQSTGARQKVLMAQYDPLPQVYSHDVLVEMGLQPMKLDAQGEEAMKDKFGG